MPQLGSKLTSLLGLGGAGAPSRAARPCDGLSSLLGRAPRMGSDLLTVCSVGCGPAISGVSLPDERCKRALCCCAELSAEAAEAADLMRKP